MGMDVMGKNAKTETGEYFRRNVWGWRPLWGYALTMHADIASKVSHGQSNDGDGLDADDAYKLGLALYEDIADGVAAKYVADRDAKIAALPLNDCEWCDGTGTRTDRVGVEMGMVERKWCNGCEGAGKVKSSESMYDLNVDDIREFADFLVECGGFEIW